MYKPSYSSGYKFGTGMKQQQDYPIKQILFFSGIHPPECIHSNPWGHFLGYMTEELQYKTS